MVATYANMAEKAEMTQQAQLREAIECGDSGAERSGEHIAAAGHTTHLSSATAGVVWCNAMGEWSNSLCHISHISRTGRGRARQPTTRLPARRWNTKHQPHTTHLIQHHSTQSSFSSSVQLPPTTAAAQRPALLHSHQHYTTAAHATHHASRITHHVHASSNYSTYPPYHVSTLIVIASSGARLTSL